MVCHLHLDDWSDMASFGRDGCVALHEGEGVQRAVLGADDEAGAGAGQGVGWQRRQRVLHLHL